MVLVKRGGRSSYTCAGCSKLIAVKEPHLRAGGPPFKRYHQGCEVKAEVQVTEPQVSEVQVTGASTEPTETPSSVEEVPLLRNRFGQFVKKS